MQIAVKFFKVLGLPSEPVANAFYFIEDEVNSLTEVWLTDVDGVPFRTTAGDMTEAEIMAAIGAAIAGRQALDGDLTAIAGLDSATAGAIASDGAGWIKKTYAQFKTALGLVGADVGLDNADNTSDENKPVSTAQAAADTAAIVTANAYADTLVVGLIDDRGNFDASGNVFPSSGGSGAAGAIKKGDMWAVSVAGTVGGHPVTSGDVLRSLIDTPGQTDGNWAITENNFGYVAENSANKDASGGYVGLSVWKIKFRNAANTFTSFLVNAATAARTYTFQNRDGTIADDTDLALKAPLSSPAFTDSPTAPTPAAGDNDTSLATTAFVRGEGVGVQRYRADFTQTGTAAPTASIYENTIGAVVWTYTAAGTFTGTLTGAFLAGKVPKREGVLQGGYPWALSRATDNTVILQIFDAIGGFLANDLLSDTYIQFEVWA